MGMLTFDNTVELFHVVVCFAIVHHCSNREDQLRLYLREPIEHTLQRKKVGSIHTNKPKGIIKTHSEELLNGRKLGKV